MTLGRMPDPFSLIKKDTFDLVNKVFIRIYGIDTDEICIKYEG
jgi:hypothetical protein